MATTPPLTNPPTGSSTDSSTNSQNQNKPYSIRDARFWIAIAIIAGLVAIRIIVVVQTQYTQATTLAGIFSGWITSIVAFYFYGQTASQAQNQIATSTQNATNAQKQADDSKNKITKALEHVDRTQKDQAAFQTRTITPKLTADVIQQEKLDAYQKAMQEIKDILTKP